MPDKNQLVTILKEGNIEKSESQKLYVEFAPLFQMAKEFEEEAKSIKVDSIDQKDEMLKAREMRLKLVRFRGECDTRRKELKDESLRKGKAIDGMANIIKYLFSGTEAYLKTQEEYAKNIEKQRLQKLKEERENELSDYGVDNPSVYNLHCLSEVSYKELLNTFKERLKLKIERERKEEEDRVAAAKKETERLKKLEKDNKKLKEEAKEKEDKLADEKKKQAKIDADKEDELEKERKKTKEAQAKLDEKERIEKEEKEAAEKEKRDKLNAPMKERLLEFSQRLSDLDQPTFEPGDADAIITKASRMIDEVCDYIKTSSDKL